MANYPNSIPVIPTLTGSDYPKAEHLNAPNREIEAISLELGTNPRAIAPAIPRAEPQSIAHYLDMLAYIIKGIHRGTNWYDVTPVKQALGCTLLGATVGAGATVYASLYSTTTTTVNGNARIPVPFAARVVEWRVRTHSAQPGTGSLVVTLERAAVPVSTITIAAGSAANTFASGAVSLDWSAGQTINFGITNNAAAASAQIGMFVVEMFQRG
jgi:hypothetical protein